MALPSISLIHALRTTAQQLRDGAAYSWGHHGHCNCGNLAQVVTAFTPEEIQRYAHTGVGEWTELAMDFCEMSGAPVDLVLSRLVEMGLTPSDIQHIEHLSDKSVLQYLSGGFRWLKKNRREDAIAYFEAFAAKLEDQLLNQAVVTEMNDLAIVEQEAYEMA